MTTGITPRPARHDDAGGFREDIFFQLNVVSEQPEPVRERQEDILLLARESGGRDDSGG
ncbi:hypothetical protein [Pyxidicoccus sp. MSG2]|uniref:hypothetical protein n=1 Tax=Pyxidicoccus sp. MSG2 TaxID=2996790 RepID=UPI0022710D19|nr:hypothetical protein [Pyxidicoccus sp. MSG2]MCY1024007.1 hypothetical protein [Pyxidicoccus sp. MSG2]